jgi:hypothetical protein
VSLEGELRVALRLHAGRIAGVDITSTRPDIAQRLLQGRRTDEAQAAVPLLFSVCARSQAAACRLACAAAAGGAPDTATLAQVRAAVAEETVRESAWQALLHLPRWMDEAPTPEAKAAARAARAWRCTGTTAGGNNASADAIAQAVFGCSAQAWLQHASWAAITGWAAAGETAAARYLHALAQRAGDGGAGEAAPLLPLQTPGWLAAVATAAAADPAYSRSPVWQGRPAETGALARLRGDPLLGSDSAPAPSRLLARHVARLRELALLLAGRLQPGAGALTLAPGSGVGWADNARGLLVHHVQLDGDHVRLYRIVAPTEWNFHPQGALATALTGAPAVDAAAARGLALRLVNSLDPCVSCSVEVADA